MTSDFDLPHGTIEKKKVNPFWKVVFIFVFIFDLAVSFFFYASGGLGGLRFTPYALIGVSFWFLPLVTILLFLEIFQDKLSHTFKRRVWVIILSLLTVSNTLFACWLWQIYISNSVPSYKSMTVIATGPAALALAITEFIACLFYIIQEQPQGQSKVILISSLVFVILINMYFGIFGFLL